MWLSNIILHCVSSEYDHASQKKTCGHNPNCISISGLLEGGGGGGGGKGRLEVGV